VGRQRLTRLIEDASSMLRQLGVHLAGLATRGEARLGQATPGFLKGTGRR